GYRRRQNSLWQRDLECLVEPGHQSERGLVGDPGPPCLDERPDSRTRLCWNDAGENVVAGLYLFQRCDPHEGRSAASLHGASGPAPDRAGGIELPAERRFVAEIVVTAGAELEALEHRDGCL